jgi:diguanylate cyclase (GGDEF)-like protein
MSFDQRPPSIDPSRFATPLELQTISLLDKNLQKIAEITHDKETQFQLARLDPVTGLPNRLAWDENMESKKSSRHPLAVLIIDLDKFKQINDTHGHPVGDKSLHDFAQILHRSVRSPDDLIARYGGDEFTGLIDIPPGIDPQTVLDKIKKRLYKLLKAYNQNTEIKIGFSIGESISTQPPHDPRHLLCEADKAMYDMKRNTEPQRKKNSKNSL